MKTDITEKGLESLIAADMTALGWLEGNPKHYDRDFCLDMEQLHAFVEATQPKLAPGLDRTADTPHRRAFQARIEKEVARRGVIDVLRHGVKHGPLELTLFYGTPSPGNTAAEKLYKENRFTVTRQLRYSNDQTRNALDMCLFLNGLPIVTFELKSSLTKQTVADAMEQYKRDRDPREPLFQFGRSVVHFAVDDSEVRMCTELKGKASWFLPFNQGWKHGAGNPPNAGVKTDYLWKEILAPASLTNILENYAQIVEVENKKTGRKKRVQVFPRYHQLKVVRKVLADVTANGPGQRYLLQHSAGSGKSNSIAWLAHQLIAASRDGKPVFDSIFVITDRRLLDRQIETTIKQFLQIGATVGYADDSAKLVRLIEEGKKIIISTVQKFPHLLKVVGDEHRGRNFAIIIDEAHSSQGGESSASLNEALADPEDTINDALERRMQSRKMLSNSSYFAFTATPKPKTLEMFGVPSPQPDGEKKFKPFDEYTMRQAIDEGFILDVLQNYTPVESYYRLVKKVEDDPQFDAKRAKKKLRKYVEGNSHPIRLKAEIMVDHFHEQVLSVGKIGGKARAMVVSSGIERAIKYFHAFQAYLLERKSPYKAVVAFSGEVEYGGAKVTEASLNGFPSNDIADRFQEDPYRFLICADKFQTGYDEPLLHTMYVDKPLSGVKAVQTLSRLNRSHPDKRDVFVLDFMDNADAVTKAFSDYHCTTILSKETDPNKLHDLQGELDRLQVYTQAEIDQLVERFLAGEKVDALHPILDICVARYLRTLNEDGQVEFKGKAKGFTRTYDFLASVLPYTNAS